MWNKNMKLVFILIFLLLIEILAFSDIITKNIELSISPIGWDSQEVVLERYLKFESIIIPFSSFGGSGITTSIDILTIFETSLP